MHIKIKKKKVILTSVLKKCDTHIKIIVSDQGESFNYQETKQQLGPYKENENIDFLREGGLGLFLIESLMDEVTVDKETGVTISMIKYIKKEQVRNNDERVEIS